MTMRYAVFNSSSALVTADGEISAVVSEAPTAEGPAPQWTLGRASDAVSTPVPQPVFTSGVRALVGLFPDGDHDSTTDDRSCHEPPSCP